MIEKLLLNKPMLKPLKLGARLGGVKVSKMEPHSRFQLPEGLDKTGAYIHIPFCKQKCPFCPFRSVRYDPKVVAPYVEGVKKEISLYRDMLGDVTIGEIYFGGGTPSLVWRETIDILEHLRSLFRTEGGVGIELNPEDVTEEMCDALLSVGVDRVSMGIQSFEPQLLSLMGRINYDERRVLGAITMLLDKGFHVSLDMMYNLPNQDIPGLIRDAEKISGTGVHQVAYYVLALFYGTPWYRQVKSGNLKVAGRRGQRKMSNALYDTYLANGYDLTYYGFEKKSGSRKQFATCQRLDTEIGIGISSFARLFSGTGGVVYANTAYTLAEYLEFVNNGQISLASGMAFSFSPRLQRRIRFLMKRAYPLMQSFGLTIEEEDFEKRFGIKAEDIQGKKPGIFSKLLVHSFKDMGVIQGDLEKGITLTSRGFFWFNCMHNMTHSGGGNRLLKRAEKQEWLDVGKITRFEPI